MARFVRSHQQMQIFKTGTEPTVAANGLKVGDLWIDTTSGAISQVCTAVGPVVFKSEMAGTTTNDNAATGSVGEHKITTVAVGGAVSLTTNTAANIATVSLTAGDWEVWASGAFTQAATTKIAYASFWVSSTSATLPGAENLSRLSYDSTDGAVLSGGVSGLAVASKRFSLSSTTTLYLSARIGFTVSTLTGYGTLYARRIR